MKEYLNIDKSEDSISICFYIEQEKPFSVGEKMNEICEDAYMNGYNWETFFNYYLKKKAPTLLKNLDTDPEAGMYVAYYDFSAKNEKKAKKFAALIEDLIENEDKIYRILRKKGHKIEWD
ncbi:MAG: immunity 51 family protein [Lachnospiraceae bacterium]|nr:immunity 51 family protein [Lachnospiraceae bacterium]